MFVVNNAKISHLNYLQVLLCIFIIFDFDLNYKKENKKKILRLYIFLFLSPFVLFCFVFLTSKLNYKFIWISVSDFFCSPIFTSFHINNLSKNTLNKVSALFSLALVCFCFSSSETLYFLWLVFFL